MVTIDEAQVMLDDIAESIPIEFYNGLNGGILLLPEAKLSPYAQNNDLWILGEYSRGGSMGRLIRIYFGSFEKMYSHLDPEAFKEQLRHTLLHEFTHHVESLAGEKGLEDWDEDQLEKYLERVSGKS
ncbi:MAG: metallopeptidase family protein [Eubacteriaceae bacterium]|nr:metallopeptidase family protein [Eubacteriaceae bacterium]